MSGTEQILVVIQARKGSTRLPGKILMPLAGEPLLVRMYERVVSSDADLKAVIATTEEKEDDEVEDLCRAYDMECFRGHPYDLLDRHYKTALAYGAKHVAKIPSDCPLICPDVIKRVADFYLSNIGKYDYVSNLHPATYPDGNDVEVMPFEILETAWKEAGRDFEREHTTPYIWEDPQRFRLGNVEWETGLDFSMSHRMTIDYPEDYEFIKAVYEELYPVKKNFTLCDIMLLLERKPEIKDINSKYAGVNWYRHHLGELKTITHEHTKQG
ncbi:MAG: glycosyltransferase family protein [Ignavibacteria bacterium]|nr:glycosyltransferase family protein [Ignavibacteria bacterium]